MDPDNPTHVLFAERGLRATRQRTAIYEALMATKRHPTAEELFDSVQRTCPGMSRATVYNNIDALADAGLIQVLPPEGHNGPARYDATTDQHIHLRDAKTGRVADAPEVLSASLVDSLPKDVIAQIETAMGFKCDRIRIELVGSYEEAAMASA